MFMTYSDMNKTLITTQKFCLVLVLMSVVFMMPLIIGRGVRGNWSLSCTPTHLCGVWVALRWPMVMSAFMPLTASASVTQWAQWIRGATMAMVMGMSPMVTLWSADWGWRIIQVIRDIILSSHITCSHIHMTITTTMIMVIISMPPIVWMTRSRGDILVMILWITRPGVPASTDHIPIGMGEPVSQS